MSVVGKTVGEVVRELETNFISGNGTLMSKYVTDDLYEDINRIYAYLNSKHISGSTDSQGRDKPFFNIVLAARNIYYRATDIDRKNIEIKPTKSEDVVPAFLATILLQKWMREENFGAFLNDWGLDLAGFNSSVVKFIESQGKLHAMVVPWSRLICDQINFDQNPKIEILQLTEAELYRRVDTHGYDAEMVEKLCDAVATRELTDRTKQDQKTGYIKVYEVHGDLPLSYVTGKEKDDDKYAQQMHVISFVESKEKGRFDDFTLVSGREERDPYMLTSLLPATDGSISLDGSVKNLFEAQWMMNHTAKSVKDQLDIASKMVFQTSDGNFVGRNVLTAIEQGDILIHKLNEPLTQVNNSSHDITIQQAQMDMWKGLASEINGVSESMLGNVAPSGTAWRQVEALLQESHSLFELMTENKGLCIEQMLRRFVIPFLKKQMDTSEEIAATLEAHAISKLDAMYIPSEAARRFNRKAVQDVIKALETGDDTAIPSPYQAADEEGAVKKELAPLGNQRFFKPSEIEDVEWKSVLKDLEWDVEVNITGEAVDKQTVLTTLSTALQAVVNPAYANNPQAQLVVSKILNATGVISPLEISALPAPQAPPVGADGQPLPIAA
jgi:hypothetical protein